MTSLLNQIDRALKPKRGKKKAKKKAKRKAKAKRKSSGKSLAVSRRELQIALFGKPVRKKKKTAKKRAKKKTAKKRAKKKTAKKKTSKRNPKPGSKAWVAKMKRARAKAARK